jgi:glucose-6-phosphate 1-epimerase
MDNPGTFPSPVLLQGPDGACATVSPYGAHVLSWRLAGNDERLFLSLRAEFCRGTPIRGGVPVIFPQFAGGGALPKKHGFARTALWDVVEQPSSQELRLQLTEAQASHALWPFRYLAEIIVRLEHKALRVELAVSNRDACAFTFTAALHTYIGVSDAEKAAVSGLQGLRYRDTARGGVEGVQQESRLNIKDEIDRIYFDVPAQPALELQEPVRRTRIFSEGFCDAVVWNPGPEKVAQFADLDADGWRRFICVESAVIGKPVTLAPGQSWRGAQVLVVD